MCPMGWAANEASTPMLGHTWGGARLTCSISHKCPKEDTRRGQRRFGGHQRPLYAGRVRRSHLPVSLTKVSRTSSLTYGGPKKSRLALTGSPSRHRYGPNLLHPQTPAKPRLKAKVIVTKDDAKRYSRHITVTVIALNVA